MKLFRAVLRRTLTLTQRNKILVFVRIFQIMLMAWCVLPALSSSQFLPTRQNP